MLSVPLPFAFMQRVQWGLTDRKARKKMDDNSPDDIYIYIYIFMHLLFNAMVGFFYMFG